MSIAPSQFGWYEGFNVVEAVLWWIVAYVIYRRAPRESLQQRLAVLLAIVAFVAFGISDLLEAREGFMPLWLWGFKCLCGAAILAARYTWRGWSTFRWTDREFLFGLGCLMAVIALITLQLSVVPH
jgi:hypothetical protein